MGRLAKRALCFVAGHRWRRYWTPGRTWMGARCGRCGDFWQGEEAWNGAKEVQ